MRVVNACALVTMVGPIVATDARAASPWSVRPETVPLSPPSLCSGLTGFGGMLHLHLHLAGVVENRQAGVRAVLRAEPGLAASAVAERLVGTKPGGFFGYHLGADRKKVA